MLFGSRTHSLAICFLLVSVQNGCDKARVIESAATTSKRQKATELSNRNQPTDLDVGIAGKAPSTVPSLEEIFSQETSSETTATDEPISLQEQRDQRDATVWRMERLAQDYEQAIVHMWDQLLAEQRKGDRGDPFAVFARQSLGAIKVAKPGPLREIGWGALAQMLNEDPRTLDAEEWAQFVQSFREADYRIEQTEWHHGKFDMDESGLARSTITMAIYACRP